MADENKLKQAKAAFKALCEMLDDRKWHYDVDEERHQISCKVRGDDLPMEIRIRVDAERSLVMLLSEMPFTIPEDRRVPLAIAVSAANYWMVDGSFDYDFLHGGIVFRMTSSYRDSLVGKEMFEYMLGCSCHTVDEYNDKFLAVAKEDMSLEKILELMK